MSSSRFSADFPSLPFETPSHIEIPDGFSMEEVEQFSREGYVIARNIAGESLRLEMQRVTLEGLGREIGPLEYEADLHYAGARSPAKWPAGGRFGD